MATPAQQVIMEPKQVQKHLESEQTLYAASGRRVDYEAYCQRDKDWPMEGHSAKGLGSGCEHCCACPFDS